MRYNAKTWLYTAISGEGDVLYVGISHQPAFRIKDHKRRSRWAAFAVEFKFVEYPDRFSAQCAERYAIEKHSPPFNKIHNSNFKRCGRGSYQVVV
jgi:hypothetical protein